jgi:hypothetical protein
MIASVRLVPWHFDDQHAWQLHVECAVAAQLQVGKRDLLVEGVAQQQQVTMLVGLGEVQATW